MIRKSKNKIAVGVLATTLVFTGGVLPAVNGVNLFSPVEVSAEVVEGDYTYVDNGDGTATLTSYDGTDTNVVVPSTLGGLTVTTIGEANVKYAYLGAFANSGVTSVELPDTVTEIRAHSFNSTGIAFNDPGLATVKLPSSLKIIGQSAFEGNSLTNVVLPDGLTTLGTQAFSSNSISNLDLPNSLVEIGTSAFSGNNLTSITIPNSVTSMGERSFANNQLDSIQLSENLRTLGKGALSSNNLTEIALPELLTTLSEDALRDNQLTKVFVPKNITRIGTRAFGSNPLEEIVIEAINATFDSGAGTDLDSTVIFYGQVGSTTETFARDNEFLFKEYIESEHTNPNNGTGDGSGSEDGTDSGSGTDGSGTDGSGTDDGVDSGTGETGTDGSNGSGSEDQTTSEDTASFDLISGGLMLKGSPILSFGEIAVGSEVETYTSSFESPINIRDLRGTQEGWVVNLSATPFEVVEPAGGYIEGTEAYQLPVGSFAINPVASIERVGDGNGEMPTVSLTENTVIDNGKVRIAEAVQGSGSGEYNLTFAEDALSLTINPGSVKQDTKNYPNGITSYESTLKWEIVQAP